MLYFNITSKFGDSRLIRSHIREKYPTFFLILQENILRNQNCSYISLPDDNRIFKLRLTYSKL